jgi:hypothetical protein
MMTIASDKDRVRLLISDVGGQDGDSFIFNDGELETFLEMRGSVPRAAALALRTMAGNEAMVSKRIRFLELQTDGPAVAASLLSLASELEKQDAEDTDFDIAEYGGEPFGLRRLRGLA